MTNDDTVSSDVRRPNYWGCGLLSLGLVIALLASSSEDNIQLPTPGLNTTNTTRPSECPPCCASPCLDGLPRRSINDICCACPVDSSYLYGEVTSYSIVGMVPDWVTVRLSVSLPDAYATVAWMGNKGQGARLQLPPAYQVATPFGADMGGVSPAFFGVANNEILGFAEADSWLTIGVTDGSRPRDLDARSLDIATAWTVNTALDETDAYIEFYGNSTPYLNQGESVVLVQMTTADAAACGTASASVGGTKSDGTPWTESVVWSW